MGQVTDPAILQALNGVAPSAPPRQSVPQAPGIIFGAPKPPPQATPPNPIQVAKEQRDAAEWSATHNPDGSPKQTPKPPVNKEESARQIKVALDNLDNIEKEVKGAWFGSGVGSVAGSDGFKDSSFYGALGLNQSANNVAGGLDMVQGDLINQVRLQMAERGVTVGASQANTEKEAARLAASIANLSQTQDEANFQRGLDSARAFYQQRLKELGIDTADSGGAKIPPAVNGAPAGNVPVVSPSDGPGGGTRAPVMIGDLPEGTDIQFGMDTWGTGESFDRNKALQDIYGVTPNQEASIQAFWNANTNNQGLTLEGAKDWYQSQGIPLPSDEGLQAGISDAKKGIQFSTFDLSNEEKAYKSALDKALADRGVDATGGVNATASHIQQGALLGSGDEISGIIGAVDAAAHGNNPITGYQFERDVSRRQLERGSEAHPKLSMGAEIAGSLLTGKVGFGKVETLAEAARAGGKMGALAGFNYGEGVGGSVGGAVVGAALGAPLAAGAQAAAPYLGKGLNAIRNTVGPKAIAPDVAAVGQEVIQAGERQGVPIRQPDIRPELRGKLGVVEKTDAGGPIIRGALANDNAAMESAVGRLGGARAAPDRLQAGSMAQEALDRTAKGTSTRGGSLYNRAARIAGDVKVNPENAIAQIDKEIADLTASGPATNKGQIAYLNELKGDLSRDGGLSIDAVRALRTNMRGQINERNLGTTDAERRVGNVIAAASKDIESSLGGNPRALDAYKNADRYWREKKQFEKQVSDRLLGPDNNRYSPEKTTAALESMMKPGGDMQRFQRWHKTLEPEEKADWAASVAENLGRNAKGDFSPQIFLNNTGPKGSLSPRAAELVFGQDGVRALNDLKAIARAKVAAQSERNYSGTSGAVNKMAGGFRTMMLASLGFASGDATGAIGGAVAGNLIDKIGSKRAARMLMNPDFTKWLRSLPDSSEPKSIDNAFKRLQATASRSPVMAADVLSLQNSLREAFAQSPMRAAAQGQDENNRRGIPPQ